MNIYTDKLLHLDEMFVSRQERDTRAKELRKEGWKVEVSKASFFGDDRYFLEAVK